MVRSGGLDRELQLLTCAAPRNARSGPTLGKPNSVHPVAKTAVPCAAVCVGSVSSLGHRLMHTPPSAVSPCGNPLSRKAHGALRSEQGAAWCPTPPLPRGGLGADGPGRVGLVVGRGCGRAVVLVGREVDGLVEVSQRVVRRQEGIIRASHARHPGAGTPDREVPAAPSKNMKGPTNLMVGS